MRAGDTIDELVDIGEMHNRRRSSRLKSLEDKKDRDDGSNDDPNGADNEGTGTTSDAMADTHHSGHSSKDRSHKSKSKKSKKHKDKDKEKRKGRKKSRSLKEASSNANRSESSSEENGGSSSSRKLKMGSMDGNAVNGDRHNVVNTDCFTPPLPPLLAAVNLKCATTSTSNPLAPTMSTHNRTGNSSDSSQSPKPEKLKHRWRRNSELESNHKFTDHHSHTSPAMNSFNSDASEGSPDTNAKLPLGPYNANNGSPPLMSVSHSISSSTVVQQIPRETLPTPHFERIDENLYLFDR